MNNVIPRHPNTMTNMKTVVLANIDAPIRHISKFNMFKVVQIKNSHHLPSGSKLGKRYPETKYKKI